MYAYTIENGIPDCSQFISCFESPEPASLSFLKNRIGMVLKEASRSRNDEAEFGAAKQL